MNNLKVSVITICYNSEKTITDTIQSVINQTYKNIEYIIVDGQSKDDTLDIINQLKTEQMTVISEKDNGLYDALNKGFKMASGDILTCLHSDDQFSNIHTIQTIVDLFQTHQTEAIASSVYIFKDQNWQDLYRNYDATQFKNWQFKIGIQPPHPGFFVKKSVFQKVGYFNTNYKISGDFDWLIRVIKTHQTKVFYTKFVSVWMRDGGISSASWKSKVIMNNENLKVLKNNGVYSNLLLIYLKYFLKIFQIKWLKK